MSVKKLLSIDMDWLMGRCITLYSNYYDELDGDNYFQSHKEYWDKLNAKHPGVDSKLSYYEDGFEKLKLLVEKCKNLPEENILFAQEHQQIGKMIKKIDLCDVYNIDYHHDVFYNDHQKARAEAGRFSSDNWVWCTYKLNKLNSYYWVSTNQFMLKNLKPQQKVEQEFFDSIKLTPIDKIMDETFDYLFVCISEHYFPYKYRYLYDELKQIIQG